MHVLNRVFTVVDKVGGVNKGPAVFLREGKPAVLGRIEEVDNALLSALDRRPHMKRRVVQTSRGPAWLYEVNNDSRSNENCSGGDGLSSGLASDGLGGWQGNTGDKT